LAAGNALASGVICPADRSALQQALEAQVAHPDPVVQEQVAWSLARA
jgi:epoxyqueuosine reductase